MIYESNISYLIIRRTHVAYLPNIGHTDLLTTTDIYAYLIDEYKEKNDATIISKLDELAG